MNEEEAIINDIKEIIPVFNNNIVAFKSIVHKLERNYRYNRQNILVLNNNFKENDIKFSNQIKILNDKIESNNTNLKNEIYKSNINYNIDQINLNNKLKHISYNYKFNFIIFTIINITISSIGLFIYYK
jgi:hypothetical protein